MHEAFKKRDVKIIKLLLSRGVNLMDQRNQKNELPLFYADEDLLREIGMLSLKSKMISHQREINGQQKVNEKI